MLPPAPYSRRSAPLSGHAHPLAYQDSLLKALSEAAGPEQARQALLKSVGAGPLRAYVEAMEDKMLDIALELMKKWARPGTP